MSLKYPVGIKSFEKLLKSIMLILLPVTVNLHAQNKQELLLRLLIARTNERFLEVGTPVCYLNERGDTIIPYGKYLFCQTDTIKTIGFAYENKYNGKIACLDVNGNKLFNVLKCDNDADYVKEGLFRIMDDKDLIGFADTLGSIIIKPRFKFAFPFENGMAKVTNVGKEKEVPGSNGEKHYWDSNDWYYIDRKGKIYQSK
ncbi:WG repeat-containing protein [Parabacteroides sp.]